MQLAVLGPAQACHLRHLFVHLKALGLEGLGGFGGELEGQFPGEKALALGLCFEGFMQPLGAVLGQGFALGLGGQRVQAIEFGGDIGVFVEESVQRELVVITGL